MIENLGLVKAIFKSATPPVNKDVIWRDISSTPHLHKHYNTVTSEWEPFILSVLIDNVTIKKDGQGKLYVDVTELPEFALQDKSVTLAKMADVPQDSVLFRQSPGMGSWEIITLGDLKSKLGLIGVNTGDEDLSIFALKEYTINGHPLNGHITLTPEDIGSPAGSGTSTGINTGDETEETILYKLGIDEISGINTGDEDYDSILDLFGLEDETGEEYTLISKSDLANIQKVSTVFSVTLPAETTVAGRILGATEGDDYPSGWILTPGTNPVDILINHNTERRVASVSIFSVDGTEERLLLGSAAYSGIITLDENTLRIESLATITRAIKIYITFA